MSDPIRYNRLHRLSSIDLLRGVSILLMVVYHFVYDLVDFRYADASVLYNPAVEFIRILFAALFILMSGMACHFSRSNIKRGLQTAFFALCVTAATYLFNPNAYVVFGILHFMAFAALFYGLLGRLLQRIPLKIQAALYFALLLITSQVGKIQTKIPYLWIFGIYTRQFTSTDYFPIFPYIFLFLLGTTLGSLAQKGKLPPFFYTLRSPFLEGIGKRTIWVYLLHQPVSVGILYLIQFLVKSR